MHRLMLLSWLPVVLVACYPSNVLDDSLRGVQTLDAPGQWQPVDGASFAGAYASERIEGAAAAGMIEVRYVFHPDGTYTGAALVQGARNLEYQTLNGTWALDGYLLLLDDQQPGVAIERAGDRLKITSSSATVILRRFELL